MVTEELRDMVRQAGVLPDGPVPVDEVVGRARRLRRRRRITYAVAPVLAAVLALALLPGLFDQRVELAPAGPGGDADEGVSHEQPPEPGLGAHAGLELDGTDRIEVRELIPGFGQEPAGEDGDLVGALADPDEIERIVRDLQAAHVIDAGDRPAQTPAADFVVVFWRANAPLAHLGYYVDLHRWGPHEVAGRWTDGFIPLNATAALPDDAVTAESNWVTEPQMRQWQAEHGDGTWVVGYFFPDDFRFEGPPVYTGLEPRWARVSDDPRAFDSEHHLRLALAELQGTAPSDLLHPLEGYSISLQEARLEGPRLILNFIPEPWADAAQGTTGEGAMLSQIAAAASHYYPEADELCILLAGEDQPLFSHGRHACPIELPG